MEDIAEFLEPGGWILDDREDRVTLRNLECHQFAPVGECGLELVCHLGAAGAVETIGQLNDQVISHWNAREHDRDSSDLYPTKEAVESIGGRLVEQQGSRPDSLGGSTVSRVVKRETQLDQLSGTLALENADDLMLLKRADRDIRPTTIDRETQMHRGLDATRILKQPSQFRYDAGRKLHPCNPHGRQIALTGVAQTHRPNNRLGLRATLRCWQGSVPPVGHLRR